MKLLGDGEDNLGDGGQKILMRAAETYPILGILEGVGKGVCTTTFNSTWRTDVKPFVRKNT